MSAGARRVAGGGRDRCLDLDKHDLMLLLSRPSWRPFYLAPSLITPSHPFLASMPPSRSFLTAFLPENASKQPWCGCSFAPTQWHASFSAGELLTRLRSHTSERESACVFLSPAACMHTHVCVREVVTREQLRGPTPRYQVRGE